MLFEFFLEFFGNELEDNGMSLSDVKQVTLLLLGNEGLRSALLDTETTLPEDVGEQL